MGKKKKKVIIDCDPGHDDVMAILSILASDDVEVLGITTVCGNNYCNVVTENLLNVLSYINRTDICVAKGQDRPLIYNPEPQDAHGYNGLEGFDFPQPIMQIVSNNAVEFMKNLIDEEDNKVTILALAPLTNIALLLRTYPEVKKNIDEIILMGGSIYRGNILARSEFNIYADPHAAEMVMESGVKTVILPLEGCDYCLITEEDIAYWENEDGRASRIVAALMNFFAEYGRKRGRKEFTVFDLGVSMYLLHPEMFEGYNCSCKVVLEGADTRGMTIIEPKEKSHIKVLTKCDTELFRKYIREDIDKVDKQFAINYPNE